MQSKKNFILLHLSFIMMSFPSLFAKGIDIEAGILSWWRCLFGALIGIAILLLSKKIKISKQQFKWMVITGLLMGMHWWTYFASIQIATVGIGLISLFTYPIISVLLEPIFFKTKMTIKQIIGALGIVVGVFFLVPEFSLQNNTTLGVLIGVSSACFFAVRNILTRKYLSDIPTLTTMSYHIIFALVALSASLLFQTNAFEIPTLRESGLILILATFFTFGSHGLLIYSLKHFTVSTIGILGGLQVVYGTLLAYFIFKEIPTSNFYLGVFIILGVAVYEMLPFKKKKNS